MTVDTMWPVTSCSCLHDFPTTDCTFKLSDLNKTIAEEPKVHWQWNYSISNLHVKRAPPLMYQTVWMLPLLLEMNRQDTQESILVFSWQYTQGWPELLNFPTSTFQELKRQAYSMISSLVDRCPQEIQAQALGCLVWPWNQYTGLTFFCSFQELLSFLKERHSL